MTYSIENVPYLQGMVAGMGVNMVTGKPTSLVFPNIETTSTPNSNVSFTADQLCIQTAEDYASLIEVVAKAEGQAWTEGGEVSVSASSTYLREQKFNAQILAFVLHRVAMTSSQMPTTEQLDAVSCPVSISQKILSDPTGFLNEYGTHMIAGFLSGGSFVASITIEAISQSDMQTIKAKFATTINDFEEAKGSIDAAFKQNLQEESQTHITNANASGSCRLPTSSS